MIDKLALALALMGEAFADAQVGAANMADADLAEQVDAAQKVVNAASAVQALRVAQYAGREVEQDDAGVWVDVDHGVGHQSEWASDCFGPMAPASGRCPHAMGPVMADRKVHTCAVLASRLPVTLAAMAAGDLDPWRATIIAFELSEASPESCAAVEALLFPAVLPESPGMVTRRVRRVLARVDADALRIKAAKERLDRFVRAWPSNVPGLSTWAASLPAAESAACWAAIDELALQMRGDDPTRTLEQCRADALVDLLLTNVEVTTTVTLGAPPACGGMIPVQTATVDEPDDALERDLLAAAEADTAPGPDTRAGAEAGTDADMEAEPEWSPLEPEAYTDDFGQPTPEPNPFTEPTWQQICTMGYEIPGIGVIGGDVVAGILDRFNTRIARVLLDERTGVVIETSIKEYLPNAAMRRFVQKRDGHCRFPGCARSARRCEPDHVIRSPKADPPPHGTSSPPVNIITGSNTTPAGPWSCAEALHGDTADRPPRPPVPHPPGQPPRARRLSDAAGS